MKNKRAFYGIASMAFLLTVVAPAFAAGNLASLAPDRSLIISDGSRFVADQKLPRFSWDVTPQYFMFGDGARVLRPEEVSSIAARTDFICIEKSHGLKELGAAELGAKHEAAAFKKIKPGIKVLFYFNSAYAWPFTSYNQGLTPNKIDQHPELKKFLLVDPATGKLAHRNNVFFFDVLNPELREWWASTVAKGVADSGCDGAFIDQMHGFAWLRKDRSEDVQKAMGDMMALLKKKMGPDKILLGNNANQEIAKLVFPVIDASMFEHYGEKLLSKESLLQDWADMLRLAKAWKMSIFRIGVESDRSQSQAQGQQGSRRDLPTLAKERVEYYLACYLIGAQPYSYFQYGWGWALSSGSLQDYAEMRKPLGAPKGPYQRVTADGWEFTREFEHASVWVDTDKEQAKITWKNEEVDHASELVGGTIFPEPVSRNTFMVFGNTYIQTPEAKTSILASINKAVEDAHVDFVIMVGEVTIGATVDQFNTVKYVMEHSPVPVYVTASNHDLVYPNGDWRSPTNDNFARFSEMLKTKPEYTIAKGRSFFIMQSHVESVGTDFSNNELAKLENDTSYDFVYHVTEVPLIAPINLASKPVVGISGGSSKGVNVSAAAGRHARVRPTENKINDDEDGYLVFKEHEGCLVVDSYVDRRLDKSFKIIIDRSAGTCSVETP